MTKKSDHAFLLQHYAKVNAYLSADSPPEKAFLDAVVSFCTVVEKVLKIKLHKKNPVLIFDAGAINENTIVAIALRKEETIQTAKINEILKRFGLIFRSTFSDADEQALSDIYRVRNALLHGYKPDNKISFDREDLLNKMGTIWVKISSLAIKLFGKTAIKMNTPKRKYTEKELEQALEDEVSKMIKPIYGQVGFMDRVLVAKSAYATSSRYDGLFNVSDDKCPRCGLQRFSLGGEVDNWVTAKTILPPSSAISSRSNPILYKCKDCNLELTEKQYAIAKKIIDRYKEAQSS